MKSFSAGWTLIRIYTFAVYVFMFAPIIVVTVLAFNPKQFGIFPMEGVSLRWFIKLAQNESIIDAFQNSLVLGSLTAVISTFIGILAAMAFIRFEFPGKNTLNTLLLAHMMKRGDFNANVAFHVAPGAAATSPSSPSCSTC